MQPEQPLLKRKRARCVVDGCRARPGLAGECRWCKKQHCSHHRLPESHTCPGIQACRDEGRGRLSMVECQPARMQKI
jgi:predicted nucleic acid binding AN1-type Zn finger protein